MRSLFSAVSGLRSHQARMDVIGNNVANVNTPGFKSGRVTFQEVFSQTLRGASSPTGLAEDQRGGINAMQIGLGVDIASIDTIHTPGSLQPTSRVTDVAIEGNGFFVVAQGNSFAYTRVGAFDIDGDGVLVDTDGRKVMGWVSDSSGVLPVGRSAQNLSPLEIRMGSNMPAKATTNAYMAKNLNAEAEVGSVRTTAVTVYDSLGAVHTVTLEFEKTDVNEWEWTASGGTAGGSGTMVFNTDGSLNSVDDVEVTLTPAGADPLAFDIHFDNITQVAGPSTVEPASVDGWATGTLESFTCDPTGMIFGFYSNGQNLVLGQIALCSFSNPGGLVKQGNNLYVQSNNSGAPDIGEAGTSGRGTIAPSSLEMSNVDLAEEFTQMIITQRGFQANSRVITVSDELLQELVNLKR